MAAKKNPTGSKPFAGASGSKGRKPQGAMGYGTTKVLGKKESDIVNVKIRPGKKNVIQASAVSPDKTKSGTRKKALELASKDKASGVSQYRMVYKSDYDYQGRAIYAKAKPRKNTKGPK